jgi:hypothetical protein
MATEVKHGLKPKWKAKLQRGRYGAEIRGHYTHTDGPTAAGVAREQFNSKRPAKRRAELLGMRTAFVCWFMERWMQEEGKWATGVKAFTLYPYRRLNRRFKTKGDYLFKRLKKGVR